MVDAFVLDCLPIGRLRLLMGQKMSANVELSHAMKKLRLSHSLNDDYTGAKSGVVAHVIANASPYSPQRKEAGRESKIMANAVVAPLVDISVTDNIDDWNEEKCRNTQSNNVCSVNLDAGDDDVPHSMTDDDPILFGYNDDDTVSGITMTVEAVSSVGNKDSKEPVSNQDLLVFFHNCEENKQRFELLSCCFDKNEHSLLCLKTEVCLPVEVFLLKGFEPSNEAIISYLKRTREL